MIPRKTVAILFAAWITATPLVAIAGSDAGESAYLGVSMQPLKGGLAEALHVEDDSGVLIGQVLGDSPAEEAGLEGGDIIVALDGERVGTPSQLRRAIRSHDVGDTVEIEYRRDGYTKTVRAMLAEKPSRTLERPFPDVRDLRFGGDCGFLGVMTQSLSGDLGEFFGVEDGGALVSEVVEDSPASKLGLKAGDVIIRVDDTEITNPQELRQAIRDYEEEGEVEVVWVRDRREERGKTMLEIREGPVLGVPHFGRFMPHLDRLPGRMRQHVQGLEFDDADEAREAMRSAIEELKREMLSLREELDELKRAD